jgi:hypothetical protein
MMAETIVEPTSVGADYGEGAITDIAIGAGSTVNNAIEIPPGANVITVEVAASTGAQTVRVSSLDRRPHGSASWQAIASTGSDYSSPESPMIDADGTPFAILPGTNALFRVNVKATDAIRTSLFAIGPTSADIFYRIQ